MLRRAPDAGQDATGWRRLRGRLVTALAVLLVYLALVLPTHLDQLTPAALLRIPVEGIAAVALLPALLPRPRRVVATLGGATVGVLLLLRMLDMGFREVLARPFDPVFDWSLLGNGAEFLTGTFGRAGGIAAAVAVVLLAVALVVLLALAGRRVGAAVSRHPRASCRAVAACGAAWVVCAVLGAQLAPSVPVASRGAAALALQEATTVPASLRDKADFEAQAAVDAFRGTRGDQLLTALRGKDVMLTFVESYGRVAVDDPEIGGRVGPVLEDGTRRLEAAGYGVRSGFLTSPTAGGGSWLAHSTFLSGLWIDNQQRWNSLVASDRLTLSSAFAQAGWETATVMPGTGRAWPEGRFYGYQRVHDESAMGYTGPHFGWSPMPDQFALAAYQRLEHGRTDRGPLMTEIALTSSHGPWTAVPDLVGWDQLGSGTGDALFTPMAAPQATDLPEPARSRTQYARSIGYTLESLVSWVEHYGDDNLVLIVLGDHQPAPIVTGEDASRDVPISIVTKDRGVLDRIAGWGWQPGLRPGAQAPVWPMNAFRDRFLTTFGAG